MAYAGANSALLHIWLSGWGVAPGETDDLVSEATSTQSLVEAISESPQSTGSSGTQTLGEAQADSITSSADGTHSVTENLPEPAMTSVGVGSQTFAEATAESVLSSADNTHLIVEAQADSVTSTATSEQATGEEGVEPAMTSVGSGSQSSAEAEAESPLNAASSSQSIFEEIDTDLIEETFYQEATSTQSMAEAEAEAPGQSGSGSQSFLEAQADTMVSDATGDHALGEEGVEPAMVSVGSGTQDTFDAEAESPLTAALSTQTLDEVTLSTTAETFDTSALATHTIDEFVPTDQPPPTPGGFDGTGVWAGGGMFPLERPEQLEEELYATNRSEQAILEETERIVREEKIVYVTSPLREEAPLPAQRDTIEAFTGGEFEEVGGRVLQTIDEKALRKQIALEEQERLIPVFAEADALRSHHARKRRNR